MKTNIQQIREKAEQELLELTVKEIRKSEMLIEFYQEQLTVELDADSKTKIETKINQLKTNKDFNERFFKFTQK